MKNGFFSTYQKENCCSDHFGFKTPDDILFCPLQLRIIITRNHNLIMVSKSVGHQFWFKQNWRRVGFYRNNFLNHAATTVIITTQILKILRLLKLKNWISNVWLTWLLTRLLIGNSIFDFSIFYLWQIGNYSTVFLVFSKKCKVVKCLTFMCSKNICICNF